MAYLGALLAAPGLAAEPGGGLERPGSGEVTTAAAALVEGWLVKI